MLFIWLLMLGGEPDSVMNGTVPQAPVWTLELVEDLRIEPDEREDQFWASSNQVVQVDAAGHMFVLDQRGCRILEWDADGAFVRAIGGKGEGPGEFQSLVNFQIFPDQQALAFENLGAVTRVTLFEPGFVYSDRHRLEGLPEFPRNGVYSPDRRLLAATTTRVDPQRNVEITEFLLVRDHEGQLSREHSLLYWETMSLDPSRAGDAGHWAEFLGQRFGSLSKGKNVFAAFDDGGRLYTAPADRYEITVWSPDLRKLMVIGREYKPIPLSGEEVEAMTQPVRQAILGQLPPNLGSIITENLVRKAARLAEFPPVKFPIAGLRAIEDKGLLVIHENNVETNRQRGDLFDGQGRYRGVVHHENGGLAPMIFRKGFAYTLVNSAQDTAALIRYRYRLMVSTPR